MRTRTAVLLGASGLVGGYCLRGLVARGLGAAQEYSRVILLLRKQLSLDETGRQLGRLIGSNSSSWTWAK